jgi:acyl carrier protein
MTTSSREVDAIVAAWRDVLQVDHVGLDDNFFDIGGDSSLMLQIRDLLQAWLGRELSMIELFEYPTVGELAAYVTAEPPAAPAQHAIDKRAARRRQAFGLEPETGYDA